MVGLGDWFRANHYFSPISSVFQLRIAVSDFDICYLIFTHSNKLIIAVEIFNPACFSVDSADYEELVKVLPMFFCHF